MQFFCLAYKNNFRNALEKLQIRFLFRFSTEEINTKKLI